MDDDDVRIHVKAMLLLPAEEGGPVAAYRYVEPGTSVVGLMAVLADAFGEPDGVQPVSWQDDAGDMVRVRAVADVEQAFVNYARRNELRATNGLKPTLLMNVRLGPWALLQRPDALAQAERVVVPLARSPSPVRPRTATDGGGGGPGATSAGASSPAPAVAAAAAVAASSVHKRTPQVGRLPLDADAVLPMGALEHDDNEAYSGRVVGAAGRGVDEGSQPRMGHACADVVVREEEVSSGGGGRRDDHTHGVRAAQVHAKGEADAMGPVRVGRRVDGGGGAGAGVDDREGDGARDARVVGVVSDDAAVDHGRDGDGDDGRDGGHEEGGEDGHMDDGHDWLAQGDGGFDEHLWSQVSDNSVMSILTPPVLSPFSPAHQHLDMAAMQDDQGVKISFKKGELLGAGGFGRVYKCFRDDDGTFIAVKEIDVPHGFGDKETLARIKSVRSELNVLRRLEHKHIVRYLGCQTEPGRISICLEFAAGGSLHFVIQQYGTLSESLQRSYTRQILLGLKYLHTRSKPVVHRDIKSQNILLSATGVLKLADFGCAKVLEELKTDLKGVSSLVGTPNWMAPEVLHQRENAGPPSDVWSLGCTVIEMATGKPPFHHLGHYQAIMFHIGGEGVRPDVPTTMSKEGASFLDSCFIREPSDRADVEALMAHSWILNAPSAPNLAATRDSSGTWASSDSSAGLVGSGSSLRDSDPTPVPASALEHALAASEASPGVSRAHLRATSAASRVTAAASPVSVVVGPESYHIVVMGSEGAGKTALSMRFVHQHFVETVVTEEYNLMKDGVVVDGHACTLNILDTPKVEQSATRATWLRTQTCAIIVAYDITCRESFDWAAERIARLEDDGARHCVLLVGCKQDLQRTPAASGKGSGRFASRSRRSQASAASASSSSSTTGSTGKRATDDDGSGSGGGGSGSGGPSGGETRRQVAPLEAMELERQYGVSFLECSARDDYNIAQVFHRCVRALRTRLGIVFPSSVVTEVIKVKGVDGKKGCWIM